MHSGSELISLLSVDIFAIFKHVKLLSCKNVPAQIYSFIKKTYIVFNPIFLLDEVCDVFFLSVEIWNWICATWPSDWTQNRCATKFTNQRILSRILRCNGLKRFFVNSGSIVILSSTLVSCSKDSDSMRASTEQYLKQRIGSLDMDGRSRTIYPRILNKVYSSKFLLDYTDDQTQEESRIVYKISISILV